MIQDREFKHKLREFLLRTKFGDLGFQYQSSILIFE